MKRWIFALTITSLVCVWQAHKRWQAAHSPEPDVSSAVSQANSANTVSRAPTIAAGERLEPVTAAPASRLTVDDWRAGLARSSHVQDIVLAAALSLDREEKEALLLDALSLDPDNLLLNHQLMEHCLYHRQQSTLCSIDAAARLEQLDPDNGIATIARALQEAELDQNSEALALLQKAADKPQMDDYSGRYLLELGESMVEAGMARDRQYLEAVFGYLSALPSTRDYALLRLCERQREKPDWRTTCHQLGRVLTATLPDSQLHFAGGQLLSATADDDAMDAGIQHANAQLAMLATDQSEAVLAWFEAHPNWHMSDRQWQGFIDTYQREGNLAAWRRWVLEAGRKNGSTGSEESR